MEARILKDSLVRSQRLQAEINALISSFRPLLEQEDFAELAEAESYLYDARDALQDFEDDCSACLADWTEAQA